MPIVSHPQAIAIIGIGCRFPGGANSPEQFWKLLCNRVDAITEMSPERFDLDVLFDPDPAAPGKIYTRFGGFIERIDEFDADFFGIAPREARRMDPQQRLLLEVVWEALEDGGQPPDRLAGTSAGIFIGVSGHDYTDIQVLRHNRHRIDAHVNAGGAGCIVANRVSYLLDLHGPSFTVDTACSSSLTAVHLACRSLAAGECELAIAGGVNVLLAPEVTIGFCKATMLSPDGRCRAFDARANGYVRSEGVGAVVLKPLARALADGDPIQAVIRGSAINQDGRTAGMSLPSVAGQEEMLWQALRNADVLPTAIQYVEAHGTGTAAGDPTEAAAIGKVFSTGRPADDQCLIGSVKTNIGHLEVAAGIAGLIKAALALKHRKIPPNLHFAEPNPAIAFEDLKLRVPTQLEPWPETTGPAMAGVNSFGFGGANAHVLLEEPPSAPGAPPLQGSRGAEEQGRRELGGNAPPLVEAAVQTEAGVTLPGGHRTTLPSAPPPLRSSAGVQGGKGAEEPGEGGLRPHLLTLSARTPQALRELAERYAELLSGDEAPPLRDLCYTAAVRRSHHEHRLAIGASSHAEFVEHLHACLRGEDRPVIATGRCLKSQEPKLAFVFSGMGPQWWAMGRQLLQEEPAFREVLEECDCILRPLAGWSLMDVLLASERASRMGETLVAQVANCAVQIALAALWREWGVIPDAIVGHSAGEMAAARAAGALSLADALRGAFHRGRLLDRATGAGTMLAAGITPEDAASILADYADSVSLAAVNSPSSITLSGEAGALERIARALEQQDRFCRLLPVQVPYHGPQMEAIREELLEALADLDPAPAAIPIVSGSTGTWVGDDLLDAGYWWRNVRHPVRFAAAIDTLVTDDYDLFVEVSPHPVLASSVTECLAARGKSGTVLPTLRRREDERQLMLRSLATLYTRGRRVSWSGVYPSGSCIRAPTYPWQHERHWFETSETPATVRPVGIDTGHPLLGRRLPSPHPAWEADLDDSRTHYLDAHVAQDSAVFPGAGYVELALAAARELGRETPVSLEEIRFHRLLFLARPRDFRLQLLFHPREALIEIHSAPADGNRWSLNAAARLRPNDRAQEAIDLAVVRERCATPVPVEDHYRSLGQCGFRYGDPFRGLQEIWAGEAEALARISSPPGIDLAVDAYQVHPALLDAGFQLFPAAWNSAHADSPAARPLFPVSIDRLVLRQKPGAQFWAHMVVREVENALLEGDVRLVDDEGNVALACEGLRFQVLDEAEPSPRQEMQDWLYELRWKEAPLAASTERRIPRLHPPSEVSVALQARRDDPEADQGVRDYYDLVEPGLDRIATGFTLAALHRLGWDARRDMAAPAEAVAEALGIVPGHHRLFGALIRMLRASRVGSGGAIEFAPQDPAALHRQLEALITGLPAYAAEAELLRRTGEHLADILCGKVDAREILFAEESLRLVTDLYHTSPTCRAYHTLVADAVAAAIGDSPDAAPLRVLEIGAGTGAATAAVLPRLPDSTEYVFTDISPHFLTHARERFGERPGLRCSVLDIESDPIAQGFRPHAFDLVLAANVLHTTAELRTTLRHVEQLLAPRGLLVVLELTRPAGWLNLVFGLLDGWWRFVDTDLRPNQPLLEARQWRTLLAESGFRDVTNLFELERGGGALQTVVLASPAPRAPARPVRHWLLFADRGGVGSSLAAALETRGDVCTLALRGEVYRRRDDGVFELPPADGAAAHLLEDLGRADSTLHGVIHLWSLDAPAGDELSTAALMQAQRLGCGSVLGLVQALQKAGGRVPALWLVTSGSQPVAGHDAAPNISQAAVWGFGRVLMSEHADVRCRLVDLGPAPAQAEIAALAEELCGDGADEEQALRGRHRFVRRLHRASLDRTSRRAEVRLLSPDEASFRLEIGTPGSLEALALREVPPIEPGPGELSIRVFASGLGFRDVLQSLDMLPAAAFQYDDDPHGLGSECAGVVLACGEGVEGFCVGDEVIALASAAHASRVVARADLTVHKPASLSFEEAACVLNAFVTADYALNHVARIAAGERVLIHSAAGAVGLAAVEVCRRAGAEIFATAGTSEKRDYLRSLGIEHVMDSRSLAFADEVLGRTGGEGVDVVLNSLAGEALLKGIGILRPYGRFVELGKRDIYENARLELLPFQRNLSFHAIDLVQLALVRPVMAKALLQRAVEQVADGKLSLIPHTAFDLAEAEQAFRLMAQARHIGKVVLTVREPRYPVSAQQARQLCRPDATYLITGGLGGFGLAVAEWLVRQGARNLVLLSRTGTPNEDGAALAALREGPARVEILRADVGREADVVRVLDYLRRELPPLKGVFHAAMVLDDDMLVRLDEARFDAVLAPKVAGAWNLHRLTRQDALDVFVLFSSMASVIGHPMQANYAAANAFLDSFAAYRQALGLPALTIGWGAVADVGYVARHPEIAQYLGRGGFTGFPPEQAVEILGELLDHRLTHVIAARLDWSKWAAANPLAASTKRFEHFVAVAERTTAERTDGGADSPLARLRSAAVEERRELLEAYILQKVAKVVGTTPEKVDLERPLTQLGFDSLMAVELVTAFKVDLGVSVPVVRILQETSGLALVETLRDQLALDAASPDAAAEEPAPAGQAEEPIEYPLSLEQRRFWFLDRLEPGNATYNIPAAARLTGRLDVGALERSFAEILRRHEVLRAAIREVDGEPVQVFAPAAQAALPMVDLHDLPAPEREAELQRQATKQIQEPFDLGQGPLLRARLFRLAEDEHVIVLVVHHIACDAWSMNRLVREMAALYEAFSEGRPSPLDQPPFRYVDYVRQQQELLQDELIEAQLAYWKHQLAGAPAALRLPSLPPTATGARGSHLRFQLTRELTEALQGLSAREGVTLFMALLAAFQTLLYRYTGEQDICVGTAVSRRTQPGAEAVGGCFINTLVLRSDLSGGPTFRQLLQRVKEVTLAAFAHQDVPFELVVQALRPDRLPGRTPLFQAMLVLHNARLPEVKVAGLELAPAAVESGTAVTDLVLLLDAGEQLSGTLEYDARRFDAAAAARMLEHFRTLLEGIVAGPEQSLFTLPLLSESECYQVLVAWNDTRAAFPERTCLHELFEAQVERTPHAVAVVVEEARLTYQELDRRANQLAHYLHRLGVGPEVVVGVCMERSLEMAIAILGVLKAGGAYLPLDPSHPSARLHFLLEDAKISMCLTQQRLLDSLPEHRANVVLLDADWAAIAQENAGRPVSGVTADNLAYVIYTSGSTGEPKGVMIPHRAICNQVHWRQRAFPLTAADVVLQRTPLIFDPAIWEFFGPWTAGAGLVIPGPHGEHDGAYLVRLMAEQGVTTLQAVPSLLEALLDEPGLRRCDRLRRVFCGGEVLTPRLQQRFFNLLPTVELHNLYGPAEAAIDATCWRCRPDSGEAVVPIGRPIANVTAYIVDDLLQPVPIGVPGELCIGGSGLARGYMGRPELTRQRFIPSPYGDEPGDRLFRTGDLARWRADGNLEFLGRRDDQVKIRGHRVEPGEVEAVLAHHPAVRQVAVVARQSEAGDRRLVAFVVADRERGPSAEELLRHLAERLPGPMIPSTVVLLDALPRTATGKVDRVRLAREQPVPMRQRVVVAPRDSVETQLVGIWERLLDIRPIGVADDFFELGGHSLMAMRLVAQIQREFEQELPVSKLVEQRTIEGLARLLRTPQVRHDSRSPVVTLRQGGSGRPFFLVHPVGGSVLCYTELASALGGDRPLFGLEAPSPYREEEPDATVEEMANRYVELICGIEPDGPYLLGGWSMGGVIAYEVARRLQARGGEVGLLALLDAAPPSPDAPEAADDAARRLDSYLRSLGLPPGALKMPRSDFVRLGEEEQLATLLELARRTELVARDIDAAELQRRLRLFVAHLRAMRNYLPQPAPVGIILIQAEETPGAAAEEMAARWKDLARGGVLLHTAPGDHYTMLREPHVKRLAETLGHLLWVADPVTRSAYADSVAMS